MFRRKNGAVPETVVKSSVSVPSSGSEFDRALDTVGTLVATYGKFAFDTDLSSAESTQSNCETLWRELALGKARSTGGDQPARRDYSKLLRFFEDQRRHEQEYVVHGFSNLRGALQEFAECLTAAVSEDRQADNQIDTQLNRLVEVVGSNDLQSVRTQSERVITLVRSAIAQRRSRVKEQLLHLGKQVQALRTELDAVRTQATLDGLTQLFNRSAFEQEVEKVATLGLLLGSQPCLVMIDADHFKAVNDAHGHPVGDEVLRAIADNLTRHFLRKEDFVSRYGGEEFAIVVRDSTLDQVTARVEKARQVLAAAWIKTADGDVKITFSGGVSPLNPGEAASQWIDRADRALYAAKRQGRNRVVVLAADDVRDSGQHRLSE